MKRRAFWIADQRFADGPLTHSCGAGGQWGDRVIGAGDTHSAVAANAAARDGQRGERHWPGFGAAQQSALGRVNSPVARSGVPTTDEGIQQVPGRWAHNAAVDVVQGATLAAATAAATAAAASTAAAMG